MALLSETQAGGNRLASLGERRAMEEPTDLVLLERVAQRRDPAAYAQLLSRYEKRAYSLALYLTRNRELAQDAVQDAMLELWLHASSYRPGNLAGWILRLVTARSIMLVRRQRKSAQRCLDEGMTEVADRRPAPPSRTEREDLLGALRDALERLPLLDRQVLALRYAADLTQVQIAGALSLSQKTVSNRLSKALDQIRAQLADVGFVAALPLVAEGGLRDALSLGQESIPGLREWVLSHGEGTVEAGDRVATPSARPISAARSNLGVLCAVGLAAAVLAGGTAWWAFATPPPPLPTTGAPAAPAAIAGPAAIAPSRAVPRAPAGEPFSRRWDFNSPEQAKDFKVLKGSWHHVPNGGADGKGCMETDSEPFIALFNPFRFPSDRRAALLVTARILLKDTKRLKKPLRVEWADFERYDKFQNDRPTIYSTCRWEDHRIDMFDGWRTTWVGGQILSIEHFEGLGPSAEVIWSLENCRIDELEAREKAPHEMPDLGAYRQALQRIPPAKRVGRVAVPELRSARPPDPVYIEFHWLAGYPQAATEGE